MKYLLKNLLPVLSIILFLSCTNREGKTSSGLSYNITAGDIQEHISFLASDRLKGRGTGTPGAARAARYIAGYFHKFGLEPAGDGTTYFQEFIVGRSFNSPHHADTTQPPEEKYIARNVVGLLKGTKKPDSYIVIGAHFDHLGMGKFGSLDNREHPAIHNGADDNASGTAGVLELAQYFSRHPAERSLLFIAFSGEEMGLLGSQYFVEHPSIPLDRIVAMINMDMIGRLQDDKLLIFGTGTSEGWETLIEQANTDSLSIKTIPDGAGASDHTSFYNKHIPVLHYFTDTHADYHRPSDDPQYINYQGQDKVLEHVRRVIATLDTLPRKQLAYREAPVTQHRNVTLEGVTLGVMPDYGFDGEGMRITGVRSNRPAGRAGLRAGDIIIGLDEKEVKDIYEYMDALNGLEEGDTTTVTVLRNGEEVVLDLAL